MLFGTQGRPRRLKLFYTQDVGDGGVSVPRKTPPPRVLLNFISSGYCLFRKREQLNVSEKGETITSLKKKKKIGGESK